MNFGQRPLTRVDHGWSMSQSACCESQYVNGVLEVIKEA